MHVVRYLGDLTRCKSLVFETCTKRLTRQSRFSPIWPCKFRANLSLYNFPAGLSRTTSRMQKSFVTKSRKPAMNPANLPFDSEAMLQGLRGWVECESPTFDAGAVERMLDIAPPGVPRSARWRAR